MKLEFKLVLIDDQPVLITCTGEMISLEEALEYFPIKKGECLPITMTIHDENEKLVEAKMRTAHANFIKKLKEKYPDGYFRTEDGKKLKIQM